MKSLLSVAVSLAAGSVLLAGCSMQTPTPGDASLAVPEVFHCGQRMIEVTAAGEMLDLLSQGVAYTLVAVPSASGARYRGEGNDQIEFWNKGNRGTLTLAGELMPECLTEDTLETSLTARGNEPFWSLMLDNGQVVWRTPDEEASYAATVTILGEGRWRVAAEGAGLDLLLTAGICNDSMADMVFPLTAELTTPAGSYSGCAGSPERLFRGIEWQVTAIAGDELLGPRQVTLTFGAEQRVYGQGPCNRYFGGYQLAGEGLSFSQLGSTLMACEPGILAQEQTLMSLLPTVTRFDVLSEPMRLRLHGSDGVVLEAEAP
ncbi:MAG: META domain-containing protein [Marinobacter sp.]|nr:META domain-containing protein [Marinobacter sp.]